METEKEIPRLSPSIAKILLDKSPKHAWLAHRLLGGQSKKPTAAQVKGKAIDALVFGTNLEADDEMPSAKVLAECQMIAGHIKDALEARGITGTAQKRLEWSNSVNANCSGVIDLSCDDGSFYELKTSHDLSDYNITKQIEQYRYDLQFAAYVEGLHNSGVRYDGLSWDRGKFIFAETAAPYDVRFVSVTFAMYKTGSDLWLKAGDLWQKCLSSNQWPGRGDFTADVSNYRKKQEADQWLADAGIE